MTRTAALLLLAGVAARPDPVHDRAQALLDELHHHIPFDGAWTALAERGRTGCGAVASTDLDESSVRSLSGPEVARHIERTGADRARPPKRLRPTGFHEALSDALSTSAAFVSGARSGVVLLPDSGVTRIPGLSDDVLLAADSALVDAARDAIGEGQRYATFLWPRGGRQLPDGYTRATVLACDRDLQTAARGVVVLSPAGHLRGLTPRELEVLGHVIEGCSNLEIARALMIAPRTVAAHIEHILFKLDATSRTLAAVRAERAGLYVPLSRARQG